MDSNKKYGQFDRQILLKYLKRGLSPEDTWKVEKAMQDDPFLAEAMEGLEAAERFGVLTEDLEWLRRRMKKHKRRIKVLELPNLLNVAAVLLILLVSAWLVIEIARNNGQSKKEIAMQKTDQQIETTGPSVYNDAGTKLDQVSPAPTVLKEQKHNNKEENKSGLNKPGLTELLGTSPKEASKPSNVIEPLASVAEISTDDDKTRQKPSNLEDIVSISANGAGEKVEANREMSMGAGIPEKRSEGKKAARADKQAGDDMERSYAVNTTTYTEPQPVHGDSSYKEYILKSLRYPEMARNSNTEGDVVLQFIVDVDSTIWDIKIISGPGYGCHEEAVRLLKEGPKWIPATSYGKPVKTQAVFKFNFSISN